MALNIGYDGSVSIERYGYFVYCDVAVTWASMLFDVATMIGVMWLRCCVDDVERHPIKGY